MTFDAQLVMEQYLSLEESFLEFLKYVPLTEEHHNVWSFELGNIILNTGSILDSFFKISLNSLAFDSIEDIEVHRHSERPNMNIFRDVWKSRYKIHTKKIFELRNFSKFAPYEVWTDDRTLDWWENFTKIKHDRFRNKERATLKTTYEMLGGLFLVLIIHIEMIPVLIDYGLIKGSRGSTKSFIKASLSQGEPIIDFQAMPYYAKTRLFGYIYQIEGEGFTDEQCKKILSPSYPGYGW